MTLKIQKSVDDSAVVFTLSGRFQMEQLSELQGLFEFDASDRYIVSDLRDVRLVDRDAVVFLSRCERNGATLENRPPYIREWIERKRNRT
jgi:hypothetical protein